MPECNCLIPYLEGAGQHSPGCAVFKTATCPRCGSNGQAGTICEGFLGGAMGFHYRQVRTESDERKPE